MKYFSLFCKTILLSCASLILIGGGNTLSASELHEPADYISKSLPVLYITTTDSVPVTSKEYYLTGTYYLDNLGLEGYESVGSYDQQLPLQIKGRGNSTWQNDKKPYRLKLDKKASLMGMKKSKHFVLLANVFATQFYCDSPGFALSRLLGLDWTPDMKPVEVVLNGDYIGLYYLTEKIRVDSDRVNVVEQADLETDPEAITGGWLLEIDNTADESQILIRDSERGTNMRITYHSPEELSQEQLEYLTHLTTTVDKLVNIKDPASTEWAELIDLDALARFYLVNEIMDNGESFSGSCYMHKDRGNDTKLVFGPVWDFGSSYCHGKLGYKSFIYENAPSYAAQRWIGQIAKFDNFQARVRELWHEYQEQNMAQQVVDMVTEHKALVDKAMAKDKLRWPAYHRASTSTLVSLVSELLRVKGKWLDEQWATPVYYHVPLEKALEGAHDNVTLTSDLAVALTTDDYAILTDGNGRWIKATGSIDAEEGTTITDVKGTLSNLEVNPVIDVESYSVSTATTVDVTFAHINLENVTAQDLSALQPNEPVLMRGYYNAARNALRAHSPNYNYQGISIALSTEHLNGTMVDGKNQVVTGVITLNEAWDTAASSAPARIARDDAKSYQNITLDAVASQVLTGVKSLSSSDAREVTGIYNVAGTRVDNTGDGGIFIVRYGDGSVEKTLQH